MNRLRAIANYVIRIVVLTSMLSNKILPLSGFKNLELSLQKYFFQTHYDP